MVSWWPLVFIVIGFLTIVVSSVLSNYKGKAEWWHWLILAIGILFIIGGIIWFIVEKGREKTINHLVLHKEHEYVPVHSHIMSNELPASHNASHKVSHEVTKSTVVNPSGNVNTSYKHTDTHTDTGMTIPQTKVPTISSIQEQRLPDSGTYLAEWHTHNIPNVKHTTTPYVVTAPMENLVVPIHVEAHAQY